ncbi:hypothetical protein Plhal304r1_c004g0014561 [Plasmopara halstedii]
MVQSNKRIKTSLLFVVGLQLTNKEVSLPGEMIIASCLSYMDYGVVSICRWVV